MLRVSDLKRFRAAGVRLDWMQIGRRRPEWQPDKEVEGRDDHRLVWGCSPELGVPAGPFTVWFRTARPPRTELELQTSVWDHATELLTWQDQLELTTLQVSCEVLDTTRPVALYLFRAGTRPADAIGVQVVDPAGAGTVTITARAAGAIYALLVNARALNATALPLTETIEDDSWQELEIVGLPVDGSLRAYDTRKQGMLNDLRPPVEAAELRVERAGPPLGWWPYTETWRQAPDWVAPPADGLVREVTTLLLPEIERLYSAGLPEWRQRELIDDRPVDPPSQDGRQVDQQTTAKLPLLGLLGLAAGTEPFVNLAAGFGTGYRTKDLADLRSDQRREQLEFLVTADYQDCVLGQQVQVAAYVPPVEGHTAVPPVVDLTARQAALLPPVSRDSEYRESIELSWRPRSGHASLTDPLAAGLAGFDPAGGGQAWDLLPQRPFGGTHPRATISVPTDRPDGDRPRLVDAEQPLPLEGSVSRGYAVAQLNVFGLWSAWQDVSVSADAPTAPGARLLQLDLSSRFTGSTVCPATLEVEFALPWRERTPERVEVYCLFYPMPTGRTAPPAGAAPGVVPAGCLPATGEVTFAGNQPLSPTPGAAVLPLREDGSVAPVAGPIEQGEDGRRYRLTLSGPGLDFAAASRWGVQVWARAKVVALTDPSGWSPAPDQPATASAASPVPVLPVPPPLPPDVPLASTPDARGRSHVKVAWSGLDGPHVDRVVVWECSETVLRERLGPPGAAVDPAHSPGQRLAELWAYYDEASPADRRNTFRRAVEVGPSPASIDLELPRGSRDIHFYLATAVTTTGLESPWPDAGVGTPAHAHLQAAIAPRLRQPAIPVARSALGSDGSTELTLRTASPIALAEFEVFATRSSEAARSHLTMGPPVAACAATPDGQVDPVSRDPIYQATWTVTLGPSWDDWLLRSVAVPVRSVGPQAERGLVSESSELLRISVLPGPPTLEPLTAEVVGATHNGVLIRTSTSAPDRAVAAGSHRVTLTVDGVPSGPATLESLPVGDGTTAPAGTSPVVERMPRSAGRTGLLTWLHRPDPATPVQVSLQLTDPRGRSVERQLTVPPWVEPQPGLVITVDDAFQVAGRGWVFTVSTSADPDVDPAFGLHVLARQPLRPLPFPPLPFPPLPGRPPASGGSSGRPEPGRREPDRLGRILDLWPATTLTADFLLVDIPRRSGRPIPGRIEALRLPDTRRGVQLQLWIPLPRLSRVDLEVASPESGSASTRWGRP